MTDNIYEGIPTPEERVETFADSIIEEMMDGTRSIDDDPNAYHISPPSFDTTRPSDFDLDCLPSEETFRGSVELVQDPPKEKVLYLHERPMSVMATDLALIKVRLNGIELSLGQLQGLILDLLGEEPEEKAHTEDADDSQPSVTTNKRAPGRPRRIKPKTEVPERGRRKTATLKKDLPKKAKAKPKVKAKAKIKVKAKAKTKVKVPVSTKPKAKVKRRK